MGIPSHISGHELTVSSCICFSIHEPVRSRFHTRCKHRVREEVLNDLATFTVVKNHWIFRARSIDSDLSVQPKRDRGKPFYTIADVLCGLERCWIGLRLNDMRVSEATVSTASLTYFRRKNEFISDCGSEEPVNHCANSHSSFEAKGKKIFWDSSRVLARTSSSTSCKRFLPPVPPTDKMG